MSVSALHGPYVSAAAFGDAWDSFAHRHSAVRRVAGRSVQGRELVRYDFGPADGVPVLLTGLLHGLEVIGSVALLRALDRFLDVRSPLREDIRLVVMPIANPDAFHENMSRIARGLIASRRGNANGVDLNRNFPPVAPTSSWHPFSGSRNRWSPHYLGPHPLSEPESRAIDEVAREVRPELSLGFHSFGDMLLWPWAHTDQPNPRAPRYEALGRAFTAAVRRTHRVGQATMLYPTTGDLDDHLDYRLGALALTIEVSSLDRRLLDPRRLVNPFCWMNPCAQPVVEATVEALAPGVAALIDSVADDLVEHRRAAPPPRAMAFAAR